MNPSTSPKERITLLKQRFHGQFVACLCASKARGPSRPFWWGDGICEDKPGPGVSSYFESCSHYTGASSLARPNSRWRDFFTPTCSSLPSWEGLNSGPPDQLTDHGNDGYRGNKPSYANRPSPMNSHWGSGGSGRWSALDLGGRLREHFGKQKRQLYCVWTPHRVG